MDLIIKNGFIIDGTGNPWFQGDVAVEEGRIQEVGHLSSTSAGRTIDATGLIVCPGFVDPHAHADWTLLYDPLADNLLRQGITTIINGNCGMSAAPVKEGRMKPYYEQFSLEYLKDELVVDWHTLDEYLRKLEETGVAHNVGTHVGHGTVRIASMEDPVGVASEEELKEMKRYVAQAMEEGAFGLSTGLNFPPGSSSDTRELVELAKVAASYGGVYATHLREYGAKERESVEEALEVGEKARIQVHFPHYAAGYSSNMTPEEAWEKLAKARERGMQVTYDWCRSYRWSIVSLRSALEQWLPQPLWILQGGPREVLERLKDPGVRRELRENLERIETPINPERVIILSSEANPDLVLKSLKEIGEIRGLNFIDALIQLMVEEGEGMFRIGIASIPYSREYNEELIKHPLCMVMGDQPTLSDKGVMAQYKKQYANPKAFGLFPRVISKFVRERAVLTMEEAIRKMTSFPAQTMHIKDRGLLREGMWADILIFHPDRFGEKATYREPNVYSEGIEYLMVNGEIVVEKDRSTGRLPGRVLRAQQSSPPPRQMPQ